MQRVVGEARYGVPPPGIPCLPESSMPEAPVLVATPAPRREIRVATTGEAKGSVDLPPHMVAGHGRRPRGKRAAEAIAEFPIELTSPAVRGARRVLQRARVSVAA